MRNLFKPNLRPLNPHFSSGPCIKRPGWTVNVLEKAHLGRSHRALEVKARLSLAIEKTRTLLGLPEDYVCGIVPASDTGAFEMAMWCMLGARAVDILAWESFGLGWALDVKQQLKLEDCRVLKANYGELPDLTKVDFSRDVLFTSNGTTSGVRIPNYEWIPIKREGLTFADATSAAFAQPIDWLKVDILTFSWQKVLGGEAAHGMLILSPRAVKRLETFSPPRPLPKIFRLTEKAELVRGIFSGETINTPSLLCVEDYLDALTWAERVGGVKVLIRQADLNANILHKWVEHTPWISNLAVEPATRSNTSVCLKIVDPTIVGLSEMRQIAFINTIVSMLEIEKVAYDIKAHRDAPPGFRIWTGPTVSTADLKALVYWLDWAYNSCKLLQS
ncbi:MAG: phosphoserine transaminase [Hyphomicrobiaceae bacterium]|nr:phosphoserine transaminase [Hyphomicrobiaceae bacterium]